MKASQRDPRVYLEDILSAIARIERYIADGEVVFFQDEKTQDAVIRQISIIGEAAAKLPLNVRRTHTDIPWKQIIGMRNIMIHDYAETKLSTVWTVAVRDLSPLKRAISLLLEKRAA
jgi:uncharacterized protein with HEPN domain